MHMQIRLIGLHGRSRAGTIALAAAVIAIGGVLLVVGFTLLLALAAVGVVAGIGTMLYRRLTGRGALRAPIATEPAFQLDPRMEVHAPDARTLRPLPPASDDRA
jgi:hypothetical protein